MITTSAQYHRRTSYDRLQMGGHGLDWANQPNVYKTYPGIEPIPLPREPGLPKAPLPELFGRQPPRIPKPEITAEDLSALLLLTYSLTARSRHPGGDFYYRSAASAGALYPTEVYVALREVRGLEDGLYHFSIAAHGLSLLRPGIGAYPFHPTHSEKQSPDRGPSLTFFFTAILFRSSWKYRDRAFRYHLLDTGHVLEHLTLALRALDLPFQIAYDFQDRSVGRLLGLDDQREVPLALCRVNQADAFPGQPAVADLPPLPAAYQEASRVAAREVDYPLIREAYDAGRAIRPASPSEDPMVHHLGPLPEFWEPLPATTPGRPTMPLGPTVFSRRSRRNFITTPMSGAHWRTLWKALADFELEGDHGELGPRRAVAAGCLAERVEGVQPGFYLLDWANRSLGLAAAGNFVRSMTAVCLDQGWLAQAATHFLFMADLKQLDEEAGPRGYRQALMNAGRLGERLYLAATSLGTGCCGIGALYDGEAADLLRLQDEARLLYLVAVGPVKGREPV